MSALETAAWEPAPEGCPSTEVILPAWFEVREPGKPGFPFCRFAGFAPTEHPVQPEAQQKCCWKKLRLSRVRCDATAECRESVRTSKGLVVVCVCPDKCLRPSRFPNPVARVAGCGRLCGQR
jgi:hypothetical protein